MSDFAKDIEGSVNKVLPSGVATYSHVAVVGSMSSNDKMKYKGADEERFEVFQHAPHHERREEIILRSLT